jgi:predicted dehydrogenase
MTISQTISADTGTRLVRIGVIGTGMIGTDHTRRIQEVLTGAEVVGLYDYAPANAEKLKGAHAPNAQIFDSGEALIASDDIDAVLVCSTGSTHEQYVLAAIAAGKPVFCEKPLATTAEAAKGIVDAEVKGGKRLVQVGFMRRFDQGYNMLKRTMEEGLGEPLMIHSCHRNPAVPEQYVTPMAIHDTFIHEIDTFRWLLDDDFVSDRAGGGVDQFARGIVGEVERVGGGDDRAAVDHEAGCEQPGPESGSVVAVQADEFADHGPFAFLECQEPERLEHASSCRDGHFGHWPVPGRGEELGEIGSLGQCVGGLRVVVGSVVRVIPLTGPFWHRFDLDLAIADQSSTWAEDSHQFSQRRPGRSLDDNGIGQVAGQSDALGVAMIDGDACPEQSGRVGGFSDSGGLVQGCCRDVDHQVADRRQCQGPLGLVLSQQHAQTGVYADLLVSLYGVGAC